MTLQRREKILAAAAGGLTLLLALWFLFFSGRSLSHDQLSERRDKLQVEVEKKQRQVKAAEASVRRLAEWRRRALPSDVAEARVLYQAWLRELADRFEFRQPSVESTGQEPRSQTATLLKFNVRGRTKLAKLTEFLHEFYRAGHLHQIRVIDVSKTPNSTDLTVNLEVEALSLPGADRKNKLTELQNKAIPSAELSTYKDAIVKRDLFAPFRPTGDEPPDAAQTTFVTAILGVDGVGEVWLVDRGSGKDWKLHVGEPLEVGSVKGTVKSIGTHGVVVEIDGQPRRYRTGDNLRGSGGMWRP
jgi:hypothetical protein